MILKLIQFGMWTVGRVQAETDPSKIKLLEPLKKGVDQIDVAPGIGTLLQYTGHSLEFFGRVVLGFTVLWVLICGFGVMVSGGDPGKRSEWTTKMMWAIGGLAIILFSGTILRTLNSQFFF